MTYFRFFRRVPGGSALWADPSPAGELLRDEFFGATPAAITGAFAVQESGSDAASGAGRVDVGGSLAAQEVGSDLAAGAGLVAVSGALAVQEADADDAAIVGRVGISGALALQEPGADVAAGTGSVQTTVVNGFLAGVEAGTDVASIVGLVTGPLRRSGPRRGGAVSAADERPAPVVSTRGEVPQFVRPSPASARRPRPQSFRRIA